MAVSSSASLPPREVETVFRRDWICVARSSQVSDPGDYISVDLIDQPVLVIRDDDGTVRAMSESIVVDNAGGPWSLLHMPGVTDLDESHDLPFLSGLDRERRVDLLAVCVYPTLLFAMSGTLGVWYEVVPRAHDQMTLRIHLLLEPDVAADPEVVAALPEIREGSGSSTSTG